MTAPPARLYLDANASEPLRPEAKAAMMQALDLGANPASIHAQGRAARGLLETSRRQIATLLGGKAENLVFTSGGTEANALGILGFSANRTVWVGASEHPACLNAAPATRLLPVLASGEADLNALAQALEAGPALVALMLANNETGVLHPMAEIARLCARHGAHLHVDAVQAAGRMVIDFATLGAQSLAVSAHKLGGPMGSGALLLADGLAPAPLFAGGGQERARRGGTPALANIAGFAAALTAARAECEMRSARHRAMRHRIANAAIAAGAALVPGMETPCLANTLCLALPGVPAETQLIALDLEGIAVSAGAACSAGKTTRSHVLEAMGRSELAGNAIRVSLSWQTSEAEIERFIASYQALAARMLGRRQSQPLAAAP